MNALGYALMCGGALAVLAFILRFLTSQNATRAIVAGIFSFLPMTLWVWIFKWKIMVVQAGLFGGYSYLITGGAIALIAGTFMSAGDVKGAAPAKNGLMATVGIGAFVFMVLSWIVVGFNYGVGTNNNTAWANLANITKAPATEKPVLPDTDPNEFVVMDCHLAHTRAHSVLGTGGNNLGSWYDVHEEDCVQQWVAGRNWFVFPMQLNGWSEWAGFMTRQRDYSAGYVAVPADDPDGDVKIVDNLKLIYMTGSFWGDNLERHVYEAGYNQGYLIDPTIEIRDDWKPFITIAYVKPAFVIGGNVVAKVLVVDPENGNIQEYDPKEAPEWIDRINDIKLVKEWAQHFGLYSVVPDYWNRNNAGQMKPDTIRIVNTKGQHQVFQIPMLANNNNAISSNGLIIYDQRLQKGTFYEAAGASGQPSYATLKATFENITQNTRGWHVDQIQWYQIRGVATYMAIYAKEVTGKSDKDKRTVFAGVGFLAAGSTNSAEVQYAADRDEALEKYYDFLSGRANHNGHADETVNTIEVSGVVLRIGPDGSPNGHFTLLIKGDSRIFTVPRSVNPLLALVQPGDRVTISFDEPTHPANARRSARKLVDVTLDEQMQTATPVTVPAHLPAPK